MKISKLIKELERTKLNLGDIEVKIAVLEDNYYDYKLIGTGSDTLENGSHVFIISDIETMESLGDFV